MSAIGYVHPTSWNPVTGCSPISEGCKHCWAARMAKRQAGRNGYDANDPFEITLHEDKLDLPLCWKKPRRIATCFMGDLFHSHVRPIEQERVYQTIAEAEWHTFLLLTKRPLEAKRFLASHPEYANLPNVWMGVSVELQEHVDRIDTLCRIPVAVRWVSIEPCLGPVSIAPWTEIGLQCANWSGDCDGWQGSELESKQKNFPDEPDGWACPKCGGPCGHWPIDERIDWVVAGAETGPGARRAKREWFRDIRDECEWARIPFWFKSRGPGRGDMLDGRRHKELPK